MCGSAIGGHCNGFVGESQGTPLGRLGSTTMVLGH